MRCGLNIRAAVATDRATLCATVGDGRVLTGHVWSEECAINIGPGGRTVD